MIKSCVICNNECILRLTKESIDYYQCSSCKTLFTEPLENSNMVGGGNEVQRNQEQNHIRIDRINEMIKGMKKENVDILDFGCGHGMLIEDIKKAGYPNVDGYDAYSEQYSRLPEKNKYHIITAIEVIEHTSYPFYELDVIFRSLRSRGVVMFETSFVDVAVEDNIELEDFFYIDPKVGHSTIFSHHGLDVLMCLKGFTPMQHWNRHCRLYKRN